MSKRLLLILLCLSGLVSHTLRAQEVRPVSTKDIYVFADPMPRFPGGDSALTAYFRKVIPPHKTYGNLTISFSLVIDKSGNPINIENHFGIEPAYNQMLREAIQKMPRWQPGMRNAEPVNVRVVIPIYIPYIKQPGVYYGKD